MGERPREHLLFALPKALDMLLAEGLERSGPAPCPPGGGHAPGRRPMGAGRAAGLQHHSTRGARELRHDACSTPVRDPAPCSTTAGRPCGVVLGVGIGELSGRAFRIAHMGHVNAPMVFGDARGHRDGARGPRDPPWPSGGVHAAVDFLAREVRPQG